MINGAALLALCVALLVAGCNMSAPGSAEAFITGFINALEAWRLPLDLREAIDALPPV